MMDLVRASHDSLWLFPHLVPRLLKSCIGCLSATHSKKQPKHTPPPAHLAVLLCKLFVLTKKKQEASTNTPRIHTHTHTTALNYLRHLGDVVFLGLLHESTSHAHNQPTPATRSNQIPQKENARLPLLRALLNKTSKPNKANVTHTTPQASLLQSAAFLFNLHGTQKSTKGQTSQTKHPKGAFIGRGMPA